MLYLIVQLCRVQTSSGLPGRLCWAEAEALWRLSGLKKREISPHISKIQMIDALVTEHLIRSVREK